MNKKILAYIASGLFGCLTVHRFISGLGYSKPLIDYAITAAFAVFTVFNYRDDGKTRGLYTGSQLYLLGNGMFVLNYSTNLYDFIMLSAAIVLFVMFRRLYNDDRHFLHQYWFLPAILVSTAFLLYTIQYHSYMNIVTYIEPVALLLMCLDLKNWY